MADNSAIQMIQGFLQENLETGWAHLEEKRFSLARHHFERALEQLSEIEELCKQQSASPATQTLLLPEL